MTLKSRYEKISLWTRNLAMKKSRYGKISPWKNLAMKLCYRLSTYALHLRISPFCQFAFAYFSSYVFRSTLWSMLPYMFNKAGVNVSCLGIPDLQSPRHAIEPELCPPTPLSPTGRAGRGGQMKLRAPDQVGYECSFPGQQKLKAPDQKGC